MEEHLRPGDLADAIGVSPQTVRKWEELGFLPPAERSPGGQRWYGARHLLALRAAQAMKHGYGWRWALKVMRLLHRGEIDGALSLADERHAQLHREREETKENLKVLRMVASEPVMAHPRSPNGPLGRRTMLTVGEAAAQVGVRVSALHHWEGQGVVHPQRDPESGYRLFDEPEMHRLRLVAFLRRANYGFPTIATVLAELEAGRPEQAVQAAEKRLRDLDRASRLCAAATAALHEYIEEVKPHGNA